MENDSLSMMVIIGAAIIGAIIFLASIIIMVSIIGSAPA